MRLDRFPFFGLLFLIAVQAPPAVTWAQVSPPAQPSAPAAQPSAPAAPPSSPPSSPPAPPSSPPADPLEPKTADDYALEARKLALKPGGLMDARALLLTAWSMKRSYDTAGNLGSIEYALGMIRDAVEHLSFCQRHYPAVRDADQTKKLAQVEALLAEARVQVGAVRVRVTDSDGIELEGAEVLVDNKAIGRAPLPDDVFVDPGSRLIAARQPGYREASQQIEAAKGGMESVTLVLTAEAPTANTKGTTPPGAVKKRIVLIAAGAGLAAAGIGLGLGFTLASNGKSSATQAAWEGLRTEGGGGACLSPGNAVRCEELRSSYDGKELFRGVAIGGYVVGGALAVGTLAYALLPGSMLPKALLEPDAPATKGVRASVTVLPGGGGAVLEGTF